MSAKATHMGSFGCFIYILALVGDFLSALKVKMA